MRRILFLSICDFKNMLREPIILTMFLSPIIMALVVHYGIPVLALKTVNYINMAQYYPIISVYMLLLTSVLVGTVTGFLMLDEKDDNVLLLLFTTPLRKNGYIIYRIFVPAVINFLYSFIVIKIGGLIEIPFKFLLSISIMVALEAPIIALFLIIFAENKVEGLTLSKGINLFLLSPLIEYFTNSKLTVILGLIPFYWPIKVITADFNNWLYVLLGLLIHGIYLVFFLKAFIRKVN